MEKSSNNPSSKLFSVRVVKFIDKLMSRKYTWQMAFILPAWLVVAFFIASEIIKFTLSVLKFSGIHIENYVKESVLITAVSALAYIATLVVALAVPMIYKKYTKIDWEELGLQRLMSWTDIGLAPVTLIIYMIVVSAVMAGVVYLIPGFPVDQAQDVRFKAFGTPTDNVLAFITLVVLAPLAEEAIFRGYLYGKLRKYIPAILSALIVSLLFGFAHGQWNVGVNVFVLSLFLCGLRSLTGSIWAGVLVHMLKNGVAYYILFIAPLIGG